MKENEICEQILRNVEEIARLLMLGNTIKIYPTEDKVKITYGKEKRIE